MEAFKEVNTYATDCIILSLYPSYHLFHWCIQSIIHHNLTLKHVLVDTFNTYLITLYSTCFTVKWIIDHGYLLEALCEEQACQCQW